jgi:hypothetical protein
MKQCILVAGHLIFIVYTYYDNIAICPGNKPTLIFIECMQSNYVLTNEGNISA